jgi:hypothetical protein
VFDLGARGDGRSGRPPSSAACLAIPFAIGVYFGLRAAKRYASGWVGLIANSVLAVLAIGMPIIEALTN